MDYTRLVKSMPELFYKDNQCLYFITREKEKKKQIGKK